MGVDGSQNAVVDDGQVNVGMSHRHTLIAPSYEWWMA